VEQVKSFAYLCNIFACGWCNIRGCP